MEFKGNLPGPEPSLTDWERVKREYDSDAPIPYDPEDGPYDPNDDEAVEAYFKQATIWVGWPNPIMIQKDGVPVVPPGRSPPKTRIPTPRRHRSLMLPSRFVAFMLHSVRDRNHPLPARERAISVRRVDC